MSFSGHSQNIIIGRVTDAETGRPLRGAEVFLLEQHKGAITDERGEYKLENLPNGKLKIQYSYLGYKTIIKTIFLYKEGLHIDISLQQTVIHTQEVVVSGGTYSSQHENAIKIESIKAKQLIILGTPTFMEALTYIPGVDMISKGPGVSKPVIRGLSMTNILLLNNGVKMENFQFSENHPFLVDEFGLDKIEIIKGPASLLYGSDAVGGVINLIKEKPAPMGKIVGDYNAQFHTNTNGIVSNFGIKGNSNDLYWGLRASIKSHEDYTDGKKNYVPNSRFNAKSIKIQTGLIRPIGTFKLFYDYNYDKLGMSINPAIPLITKKDRKNDKWYQDLNNHLISSQNKLFLDAFKVDLNAALQMNNRQLQTSALTPAFTMVDMDLTTFSYETKVYLPSTEKSDYILGIQGANKTNRNNDAPNHVLPDAKVTDISFFGLVQHTIYEKFRVQAGLRYDIRSISTTEETNKPKIDNHYDNLSFSTGATFNISQKLLCRGNFATAYRTPNIAELTQYGLHGDRHEESNPDLKAQRSYESDISIHYHSKHTTFDVSVFYNTINDYIYISPTNDTTVSGYLIYRYSQTNAVLFGFEAGVNIFPLKWLNFIVLYSNVTGKRKDGNYLPFIPQDKLKIEIKAHKEKLIFIDRPFLSIGTHYAFSQNNPGIFETRTDDYCLVNFGLGGEIKLSNQIVILSLSGNNLLNEQYFDHLSTLKEIGFYNMGSNFSISLMIPFDLK